MRALGAVTLSSLATALSTWRPKLRGVDTTSYAKIRERSLGSRAQLVVPNGLTEDRGEYVFDLVRHVPTLRDADEAAA